MQTLFYNTVFKKNFRCDETQNYTFIIIILNYCLTKKVLKYVLNYKVNFLLKLSNSETVFKNFTFQVCWKQ